MATKKTIRKTVKKIDPKEERSELWRNLFANGKRLKWGKTRCRKYVQESGGSLQNAVKSIEKEKRMEEQSLENLIEWRQTVIDRLLQRKEEVKEISEEINSLLQRILKKKKKHDSDLKWFNKLERAIGTEGKIKGFKTDLDLCNSLRICEYQLIESSFD